MLISIERMTIPNFSTIPRKYLYQTLQPIASTSQLASSSCTCSTIIGKRYASQDQPSRKEILTSRGRAQDTKLRNMREVSSPSFNFKSRADQCPTMKQSLFGSDKDPQKTLKAMNNERASAIARVVPSREAHETIERIWAMFQYRKKQKRLTALRKRMQSLTTAMASLELAHPKFYSKCFSTPEVDHTLPSVTKKNPTGDAVSLAGRIPGLFPRQYRVPTATAGNLLWTSDWKRTAPVKRKK